MVQWIFVVAAASCAPALPLGFVAEGTAAAAAAVGGGGGVDRAARVPLLRACQRCRSTAADPRSHRETPQRDVEQTTRCTPIGPLTTSDSIIFDNI